MDGFLVVGAFVVLFVLGFPVVLAIGLPCLAYIFVKDLPLDLVAQRTLYALDSFPLVAVPVFLFVGSLMTSAGISRYIYRFADTAVGRLPGGLAQVNIFGSLIFSGMSGSALADIGGIGRIEIDAMRAKGFNVPFAAAVTAPRRSSARSSRRRSRSSSTAPSPAPRYCSSARRNRSGSAVHGDAHADGGMAREAPGLSARRALADWRELWRDFWPAAPAIAAPVILIAGMLAGFHADRDRVGHGALCRADQQPLLPRAHLAGLARGRLRDDQRIGSNPAHRRRGGPLRLDPVGRGVPQKLTAAMLSISTNPYVLLFIVNGLLLLVGMFLDSTTAILVIAPIIAKPLVAAGVDPVHLGMVVVFNLMIGLLTPPMGLALYLVADIAKISMKEVLSAIVPFYIPLGITLVLITYVPAITTWIPRLALGN